MEWLRACEVATVAMESTGAYWSPLFEFLEARGFTAYLIKTRHVTSVPGRKSDVLDCRWLQQLKSFGLLRGAFRPRGDVGALRCVARQRAMLLRDQARYMQHMPKGLSQMNLQLGQVISDVAGEAGQTIIRAILAGERDGAVLAKLRHAQIRASEAEITKALQGTRRDEQLFALKQAVALYDAHAPQLADGDRQLAGMLAALARHEAPPEPPKRRGQAKPSPKFETRTSLRIGPDLYRLDRCRHGLQGIGRSRCRPRAIQERQASGFVAGTVSRHEDWPRQGLVGLVQAHHEPRGAGLEDERRPISAPVNRRWGPTTDDCAAAWTSPRAIIACAHQLAQLLYPLLPQGEESVDQGQAQYEERYRQRVVKSLSKRAEQLGFQLIPVPEAA